MKQANEQNFKSASFEEYMKPAKDYTSFKLHEAVKLRIGNAGLTATKPITLPKFFRENCEKYAERPALSFKPHPGNGAQTNWITLTYADYAIKVKRVALMLLHVGLEPRTGVGILAHNCPEWLYANFAAIEAGGVAFGIYQTSSQDAVHHMLKTADATICIVDDAVQMEKVRNVHARLPKLRAVIQLNGPFAAFVDNEQGYYKWQDLLEKQEFHENICNEMHRRESEIYANQCATLVYTSGTTGYPKAVMLSHDNLIFSTKITFSNPYKNLYDENIDVISYLPLSHIGGQIFEIYGPLYLGAHVHFADRNALKGTLLQSLREVRPKLIFCVPRIYEKFRAYITEKELTRDAAVDVRQVLGLDRCKWCFVGAAPVLADLKHFFQNFNIQLIDCYGLSEVAGAPIQNYNTKKTNTVGKPLEGVEIKIKPNFTKFQTESTVQAKGEVCIRGRVVFMGYLEEPAQTAKAVDSEGWLHSGDIGCIDEAGDLLITGRLKELIITTGGENIPFLLIEATIKKELPMISHAFVVGDHRKYLTVLLTLKTESDPVTAAPTDKLSNVTIKWLQGLNLNYTTVAEVLDSNENAEGFKKLNLKIKAFIKAGLQRANEQALSNAQRVQKFRLLPHDFSIETQEFGPTLKTRRGYILQKYADLIETMYK